MLTPEQTLAKMIAAKASGRIVSGGEIVRWAAALGYADRVGSSMGRARGGLDGGMTFGESGTPRRLNVHGLGMCACGARLERWTNYNEAKQYDWPLMASCAAGCQRETPPRDEERLWTITGWTFWERGA